MATIISDNFNRADSSTLGTTDTGQEWTYPYGSENNWSIFSTQARSVYPATFGVGLAIAEASSKHVYTEVELVNPSIQSPYASTTEVVFRYASASYHFRYGFAVYGTSLRLALVQVWAGSTYGPWQISLDERPADGSTIGIACCDRNFTMYLNDEEVGTYFMGGFSVEPYGTQCGIRAYSGTVPLSGGNYQIVDNFLVTTVAGCASSVSYDCEVDECVDPGDGTGEFATLEDCIVGCAPDESYNCVTGECVNPGDGSGEFATLQQCLDSGCGPGVQTTNFDAGTGNYYYVVPPIVDSGEELRSKVLKTGRVTSKRTNQSIQFYPYDVETEIITADLEDGNNAAVEAILDDNSNISQSPRNQVNCPNAVLSTVRVQGDDTGETSRDRIDEIVVEVAEQGARR